MLSSQSKIIIVNIIISITVKSRVNELSKTNEAITVVEGKIQTLLINVKCKIYAMHTKNLNLVEIRHK